MERRNSLHNQSALPDACICRPYAQPAVTATDFCLTMMAWQVNHINLSWQFSMWLTTSGQALLPGLCLLHYCKSLRHCPCTSPTIFTVGHPNQALTIKPAFVDLPATFTNTLTGANPWLPRPQLTKICCAHLSRYITVWVLVSVPNGASDNTISNEFLFWQRRWRKKAVRLRSQKTERK